MNWLQKAITAWNKNKGTELDPENTSEAEFVAAIEEAEPANAEEGSEVSSSDMQAVLSRLSVLEKNAGTFVTQESFDAAIKASNDNFKTLQGAVEANTEAVDAQIEAANASKKTLAKSINSIKLASSKSSTNAPDPAPPAAGKEADDENSAKLDMKDIFSSGGSVVPGL